MFAQEKVEVMEDGTHYLQNCSHHLKESRILLNKEKIIFTLSLTHYVFTFLTYVHTFYTKGSNEWASIICKFQTWTLNPKAATHMERKQTTEEGREGRSRPCAMPLPILKGLTGQI